MIKVEFETEYAYEADGEQPYVAVVKVALPVEDESKRLITELQSNYERVCNYELSKFWGYYESETNQRTAKEKLFANNWHEAQVLADQFRARTRLTLEKVFERNVEAVCTMPSATRHTVEIWRK